MDESDSKLYGDYNSAKGRIIRVNINRCHDKPICKSDDEITNFFKGKYYMFVHN